MWNSLEIVKIIVNSLTPIIVIIIGFILNRRLKDLERNEWTSQQIIIKRLAVYDEVVPVLNDLFCYHCYIGNWKELTPKRIVEYKRNLDKTINIYAPLFTENLLKQYKAFINMYFETLSGWGEDAKIKTLFERRVEFAKEWEAEYEKYFSVKYIKEVNNNDIIENKKIEEKKIAYFDLVEIFKNNLEIMKTDINRNIKSPNINFKNEYMNTINIK